MDLHPLTGWIELEAEEFQRVLSNCNPLRSGYANGELYVDAALGRCWIGIQLRSDSAPDRFFIDPMWML